MKIDTKFIAYIKKDGYMIRDIENESTYYANFPDLSDMDAFFEISKKLMQSMDYNKRMAPNIDVEYRYVFRTFDTHDEALKWVESQYS